MSGLLGPVGAVMFAVYAVGFELAGAFFLWHGGFGGHSVLLAVAAHTAAAGWCGEGLWLRGHTLAPGARMPMLASGWVLGFLLPLFGPLACLLVATSRAGKSRLATAALSLEAQRARAMAEALERKREAQEVGANLDAIVDALKDRNKSVRIAAIDALRGDNSPEAVRLLAQSRDNTVFDVRMRAVEELGRIAKQYGDRLNELKQVVATNPTASAHRELAEVSLHYAGLGIEDPQMVNSYRELAVTQAHLAGLADREGDERYDAGLILARALRELGRYGEAEKVYRELLPLGAAGPEALLGILETQFAGGAVSSLQQTCRWVLRQAAGRLDPASSAAVEFWVKTGR